MILNVKCCLVVEFHFNRNFYLFLIETTCKKKMKEKGHLTLQIRANPRQSTKNELNISDKCALRNIHTRTKV